MKRVVLAVGLVLLLGLLGACSKQEPADATPSVEQAWSAMLEAYNEAETAQEKVDLFEAFLRQYPDTAEAGRLASSVAYYRGTELGDRAGAATILSETLAKNSDPEARFQIGMALFPLAMELGQPMDLDAIADELSETRPLSFSEMMEVADAAIAHDQWQIGAEYAETALAKATPEAFLADYPDEDFTPEEAAAKADRRKVMALGGLGWALWNLDQADQAMVAFDEAAPLKTVDYLGASDTPVDLYLGKIMLASGDPAKAMEVLAPGAVMASNEDAMAALREAYAAVNGDQTGFDDWVWSERQRLARAVDDFTLADYSGTDHDFSALADGKVTLLAFWFPT